MTAQLPALPLGESTTYGLTSNALDQSPTLGGPTQRIAKMGDRFSYKVECRPLLYQQAIAVVAVLAQGLSGKIRAFLPQPYVNIALGSPAFANAAATAGSAASMTGFTPGVIVQPGQLFNITTNGVAYLYQTTVQSQADSHGNAVVAFAPMLKAQPNSGDVINFTSPVIEGFLQGNRQEWTLTRALTSGMTFTIREAQ